LLALAGIGINLYAHVPRLLAASCAGSVVGLVEGRGGECFPRCCGLEL
jgi:hypothetical protein